MVRLDKTLQARLVISKDKLDSEPKYYISTDADLSPRQILSIRSESIVDLMVSVMENFNMPIPDEGGLLYKLKALGLKLGK